MFAYTILCEVNVCHVFMSSCPTSSLKTNKMKLFLNCVSLISALPTVIWHGMGDYGESSGMQRIAQMVKDNTDNDYVLNLVIGHSKFCLTRFALIWQFRRFGRPA